MTSKRIGIAFLKHLPYIETVIFSAGGYFEGYRKTTVHFDCDQAVFDKETLLSYVHSIRSEELTKAKFLTRLRLLHIEHWYKEYIAPNFLDGDQWELEFRFSDGHDPLKIYGSNAYPPHFNSLRGLMTVPSGKKRGPLADKMEKFTLDHHLQTLGGTDEFQEKFSDYEWSAPVIQQPDLLKEYVHLIGLIGAKILDVNLIDFPCLSTFERISSWSFEWNNQLVLITDRGHFEIEYNESSSVRISKDCIPQWFYSLDQSKNDAVDFRQLFSYLKNDRIIGITTKSQTYAEAEGDFTGSCGISLEENLPAYIKEFRLLLESSRQLAFSSCYDDGIISLYDKNNHLVRLDSNR